MDHEVTSGTVKDGEPANESKFLRYMTEEELVSPAAVARACDDAAQAAAHANDRKTEKEWLERARTESRLCEPPESSELEDLEKRLAKLGV